MKMYYIVDIETGRYYSFIDDCFIYGNDIECFVHNKDFANQCCKSLKLCHWKVQVRAIDVL